MDKDSHPIKVSEISIMDQEPHSVFDSTPSSPTMSTPPSPTISTPSSPTMSPSSPTMLTPPSPMMSTPWSPTTFTPPSPTMATPWSPTTFTPPSPMTFTPSSPTTFTALSPTMLMPPSPTTFTPPSPTRSMPPSPTMPTRPERPTTPGASSNLSTFSSLSMTERQKHDSFSLSGSVFLITSDGQTLSLPIPSESPQDPLNWSWQKRAFALASIGIFSYTGLVVTQGASVVMSGLAAEFPLEKSTPFTVETLVTAPTLFMGIGAFIWVPLTIAVGRRPVFVIASILMLLACLGASISSTYYGLLASVSLLGLAQGYALSVAFLVIIDLTFIHQRPNAIAMVWSLISFAGTPSLSLIPFMTNHGAEWRRFYTYWMIPAGITTIVALFFFPETYFKRPLVAYDGRTIVQTASEKLVIYDEEFMDDSNRSIYNKSLPQAPSRSCIRSFIDQFSIARSTRTSWNSMFCCYPQIFFCLANPLIFWVVIMTAVNFAGMMFIGATYGSVLNNPPYSLPSYLIVHVNNSAGIGALLSWPLGGYFLCCVLKRMSKKNKGVREAEHYLVGYILPVITGALSTLIYGFAVEYHWHFATYYLAYGLNCFSFISLAITNTLWVTEAFPRWAAPALVVVGGGSYVVSFAMSFATVPWLQAQGYLMVGIEITAIQVVTGLLFVPASFWGKGLRQRIHGRWAERREGALRPL